MTAVPQGRVRRTARTARVLGPALVRSIITDELAGRRADDLLRAKGRKLLRARIA